MNLPTIYLPAGPMLRGNWKGRTLGSGSDAWKYWDERRAGKISDKDWVDVEAGIARSYGTCMTMGTASTMTAIAESIGMTLPGASSIPAADAGHIRMSSECGRRIVEMVWEDLTPQKIQSRKAFENAITVAMAMGCSTNAIIHLIAQARRAGQDIGLDDFEKASRTVPVIANVRPSGDTYLMEDFFYAGGLPGLMSRISEHLHLDCVTVTGKTLGENIDGAEVYNDDVIRTVANPIYKEGALAVLKGNLAPDGCVIKPSACEPRFLKHTGPALVFDDYPSMKKAVDDPDLDVTADHVLILRNAGPQGGPGMPEWGMLPIPTKLVKQGVRDMVRLSDARMSGTSYGACILHVSPESFIGGPLALVRNGDRITLDVAARTINLDVSEAELAKRRAEWKQPERRYERGYGWMFSKHIKQANEGCDFDFLETGFRRAGRRAVDLLSGKPTHDQIKRSNPQQAENRLHRHGGDRAVQARLSHPDDSGRSSAQPRPAGAGRRSFYAALHAGARGPQQDRRVPRPLPSAAQGDRGLPGRRGACHGQPQGRACGFGRRHPGDAADEARLRRRHHRWRLSRFGRNRTARLSRLSPSAERADQSDAASGDRDQRADRLRRRAGVSRRRHSRRQRRRDRDPRASRR